MQCSVPLESHGTLKLNKINCSAMRPSRQERGCPPCAQTSVSAGWGSGGLVDPQPRSTGDWSGLTGAGLWLPGGVGSPSRLLPGTVRRLRLSRPWVPGREERAGRANCCTGKIHLWQLGASVRVGCSRVKNALSKRRWGWTGLCVGRRAPRGGEGFIRAAVPFSVPLYLEYFFFLLVASTHC